MTILPTVCIVGRPNVGKSTLFNRLIGRRKAIVDHSCGTTRDRLEALYKSDSVIFKLVDTGGFSSVAPFNINLLVKKQVETAITESDIILFVCDVTSGVLPQDEELVMLLRRSNKKVILVVNKVDNEKLKEGMYDFYQFGLGTPYPISAMHNYGIKKLLNDILEIVGSEKPASSEHPIYKIAITGRPNVGKSLFLNTLLKEERVIVNDTPGTTRDSIDTYFRKDKDLYLLIDTAGIRHKRKVKEAVEIYSASRSKDAIKRSDVSLLLIDGYEGLRNDDIRIFNIIRQKDRGCILVVNKWDLVKGISMVEYKRAIIHRLPPAEYYPIIFVSAKTGRNIMSCIDMVKYVYSNSIKTISTKELNRFLSGVKSRLFQVTSNRIKLSYIIQTGVAPPTFLLFANNIKIVSKELTNFIEKALRKEYFFLGTPIKIIYKEGSETRKKKVY